jgi:hypothetical protein
MKTTFRPRLVPHHNYFIALGWGGSRKGKFFTIILCNWEVEFDWERKEIVNES